MSIQDIVDDELNDELIDILNSYFPRDSEKLVQNNSAGCGRCLVLGYISTQLLNSLSSDFIDIKEIVCLVKDRQSIRKEEQIKSTVIKCIVADISSSSSVGCHSKVLYDQGFDLIIDRGEFDSLLGKGNELSGMLCQVYRMLAPQGMFILCTVSKENILLHLLAAELIGWSVSRFEAKCFTKIFSCELKSNINVNWESVSDHTYKVLDKYFKLEMPLLTPEIEQEIRNRFPTPLRFKEAHEAIFVSLIPSLQYDYIMFLRDLKFISVGTPGKLTAEEVIGFMKAFE